MTAVESPVGQSQQPDGRTAAVPLRQLIRAAARQHRTAMLWTGAVTGVLVLALAVTGLFLRALAARGGPNWYGATRMSVDYGGASLLLELILQLLPVLAGVFLAAPLLPREIENGTTRLAWTQAASRTRWLTAQLLTVASPAVLAALVLGAVFGWWMTPLPHFAFATGSGWSPWSPLRFDLNPVLLAGWVVLAFTFGAFLGAAIRRTLPAMAATVGCYGAVLFVVSGYWRMRYLPALQRAVTVQFQGGGYGYSVYRGGGWGGAPVIVSRALGWPDGRLLSNADQLRPAAWLRLHHIVVWITYQPASRYHVFQLIELGWLLAASALLAGGAIFLTRRRPA